MRKKITCLFCLLACLLFSTQLSAQFTVSGKIVDSETKEPLIGATVVVRGTTVGTATDLDGNFLLKPNKDGKVKLQFRSVGYLEKVMDVNLNKDIHLGTITLESDAVGLKEVNVIASIVKTDRMTPIAVSNIKLDVLEERLGNQEFPEILKQTPSVYATKQGGGYGDSRINLRGFDSNNIGVLINGVPINGMENGKVYWSNWAGLSDVTQFMQVQRGLGASKLALSSAGGTINIITKTTDAKAGGVFYYGLGNDGLSKMSYTMSTGLMENGWAVTFSGGRNAADGYVYGTDYVGWNYFLNVSKLINENHRLAFTVFGAPQWHNQRGQAHLIQDYRDNWQGERWNSGYGYINGKIVGGPYAYNEYHKPQISLNHYWTIDEKSSLATSVYASISNGGGRRVRGANKNWLSYDYNTGRPYETTQITPEGYLDYDYVIGQNGASPSGASSCIFSMATNRHDWYGFLSSYQNKLTDNLSITAGLDGRWYKGYHYEEIENLLGGEYYLEALAYEHAADEPLKKGDKVGYNSISEILWGGAFLQGEYVTDQFTSFLSTSLTYEAYRNHALDKAPVNGSQLSKWKSFLPWSVKGGFSWKFTQGLSAFANAGYFTRAPYFNNVFQNYTVATYPEITYEKVVTFEAGVNYVTSNFNATLNYYHTNWNDKGSSRKVGNNYAVFRGLDALHQGVELEMNYKPVKGLDLRGMFSWGDWVWNNNAKYTLYDDDRNVISTDNTAYIKNVHVGNAAQMSAALGVSWEAFPNFKIGGDWTYFGKNYADYDPSYRTSENGAGDVWKLPDYSTVDVQASYRIKISDRVNLSFFTIVNNLLNTSYIADATDGSSHDEFTGLVYYGFGTTWSAGIKVSF
ncbi:MAG: TonB-dependent receptor [Bacteroidales bacterium]